MSEPEDKPGSTVNQPIRDHWQVVVIGAGVAGGRGGEARAPVGEGGGRREAR